jgi:hypothetical protein
MKGSMIVLFFAIVWNVSGQSLVDKAINEGWSIKVGEKNNDKEVLSFDRINLLNSNLDLLDPGLKLNGKVKEITIKTIIYKSNGTIGYTKMDTEKYNERGFKIFKRWESDSIWFITQWEYDSFDRLVLEKTTREDTGEEINFEQIEYDTDNRLAVVSDSKKNIVRIVTITKNGEGLLYKVYRDRELSLDALIKLDDQNKLISYSETEYIAAYVSRRNYRWSYEQRKVVSLTITNEKTGAVVIDTKYGYEQSKLIFMDSKINDDTSRKTFFDFDSAGNWRTSRVALNGKPEAVIERDIMYW